MWLWADDGCRSHEEKLSLRPRNEAESEKSNEQTRLGARMRYVS
jgi:hypothetical protein